MMTLRMPVGPPPGWMPGDEDGMRACLGMTPRGGFQRRNLEHEETPRPDEREIKRRRLAMTPLDAPAWTQHAEGQCMVCKEDTTEGHVLMPCEHTFCCECSEHMEQLRFQNCPMCRRPIQQKAYVQISYTGEATEGYYVPGRTAVPWASASAAEDIDDDQGVMDMDVDLPRPQLTDLAGRPVTDTDPLSYIRQHVINARAARAHEATNRGHAVASSSRRRSTSQPAPRPHVPGGRIMSGTGPCRNPECYGCKHLGSRR